MTLRAYRDQAHAAEIAFESVVKLDDWADAEDATVAVTSAIRRWALENPHRYALIYGSPVPGYHAPEETIDAAAGAGRVLAKCVPNGDYDPVGNLPEAMVRMWVQIYGAISFELFGHLKGSITNPAKFFERTVRLAVRRLREELQDFK